VVITVRNLDLTDPLQVEKTLNNLPGVVENGLFAQRRADILLIGTHSGVERLTWP